MAISKKPSIELARKTLPAPLFQAIEHIFAQGEFKAMLVGGTALAGFYAGHRRSDDIDLFVKDENAFRSAVLAVKSLAGLGASLQEINHTQQYYKAYCKLSNHGFTVDVVEDPNLFRVGKSFQEGQINVADLDTIFKMKCATLVSRCSEKDLYDLIWLFMNIEGTTVGGIIEAGASIDAGVNGESVLLSVDGATLSSAACDFAIDRSITAKSIHAEILKFKKSLLEGLDEYLTNSKPIPLKELVLRAKKLI